jgi:signal transduction histidine kinase
VSTATIGSVSVPLPKIRNVRRNLVNEALSAPLERIGVESMADVVMVIQAAGCDQASGTVLASFAANGLCHFLPNEPLRFNRALPAAPKAISDLNFSSSIRPCDLFCSSSMVIPLGWRATTGWLIIANCGRLDSPHLTHRIAARYSQHLRRIYIDAGLRSTNKLQLDIAEATKAIAECEVGIDELDQRLANILSVSRGLLRTSACYLSMPEQDDNHFRFVGHLGVRTSSFKRLRMGAGQGLGGRVREQKRTVRSLNYSQDFLGYDAPVEETVHEGFHSAMCAPLITDGRIFGLLYAANRHLTPFTEADGEVLTELAGNVSMVVRRAQWDQLRQSAVRRHERDRLARHLHDSVVRSLMEIGYRSRLGRDLDDHLDAREHFDAIEAAAESCLQAIRTQIAALSSEWDDCNPSVENVLDTLKSSIGLKHFAFSFRAGSGIAHKKLPPGVATALVLIGREALRNAELHSGGSRASIELAIENGAVHLRVEDDGRGIDLNMLPTLFASKEHLGLRQMRFLAEENGGRCNFASTPPGGLRVEVMVPLA